jgi:hypothetical protein
MQRTAIQPLPRQRDRSRHTSGPRAFASPGTSLPCTRSLGTLTLYCQCPGGGMADAEDLKSSGDFSSWGFDSPPGHQSFLFKMNELMGRSFPCRSGVPHSAKRTSGSRLPGVSQIRRLDAVLFSRTLLAIVRGLMLEVEKDSVPVKMSYVWLQASSLLIRSSPNTKLPQSRTVCLTRARYPVRIAVQCRCRAETISQEE